MGLVGLGAVGCYAQGYVFFGSSTQNISTNDLVGGIGKTHGAGNYYYALFWSTTGTGAGAQVGYYGNAANFAFNEAGWTFDSSATAIGRSTATDGRFSATAPNGDGSTTVPGLIGGGTYYFQVVGWSADLGTTFSQLQVSISSGLNGGYLGQSDISGPIVVGDGGLVTPSNIMAATGPGIQAFSLGATFIPEPGTMALAALGGASLLLFRRKK